MTSLGRLALACYNLAKPMTLPGDLMRMDAPMIEMGELEDELRVLPFRPRSGSPYYEAFQALQAAMNDQLAFDYKMAAAFGIPRGVVKYHVKTGRLWSMGRGLFRFAEQGGPDDMETIRLLALPLGREAVASHTTALFIHDCTDIFLREFDFIVPRSKRYIHRRNIRLHTTVHELAREDIREVRGVRVTNLARSIIDAARTIDDVYQIEVAVGRGIARGILQPEELYARRAYAGQAWQWIDAALNNVKYGMQAA